ncbi:hypothetical protein J1N35_035085 [Gossypium stocksii]|uniref:Uncharacterized protein n=1 Tax=Gossypium stocksii TaxID=47602 RepID=A0A9D3UTS2_9ROSI|nr:hypothetical protein J1N35_035085 [Gossypium stocksii]
MFRDYLHLPSEGSFDEKGHFDPSLFIQSRLTFELNLHDRVLHLILTWNLRPIKTHAKLRNTNYWWLDCFKSDRRPNLALILFNDITKAIGRRMNTNITLPYGTYLSYIFRQLDISTHRDTPVSSNQPISGALHHMGYHFNAATNTWMKHDHPTDNEDDDVDAAFDDIPISEPFIHWLLLRMLFNPPPRLIVLSSMLSIP